MPMFYQNQLKIPLESLETVELFSILNSNPTKMSLTSLCVWAPQLFKVSCHNDSIKVAQRSSKLIADS